MRKKARQQSHGSRTVAPASKSVNERQKRVYSGNWRRGRQSSLTTATATEGRLKKRHTLKTQVVTDAKGEILDLDAGHRGPAADKKIYEQSGVDT